MQMLIYLPQVKSVGSRLSGPPATAPTKKKPAPAPAPSTPAAASVPAPAPSPAAPHNNNTAAWKKPRYGMRKRC